MSATEAPCARAYAAAAPTRRLLLESSSGACVWRGVVLDGVGSGGVCQGHRPRGRTSAKAPPGAHSSREGTGPGSRLAFSCPPFTPVSMCVGVRGRRSGEEERTRERDKREKHKSGNAGPKACRPAHASTARQGEGGSGKTRWCHAGRARARQRLASAPAKVWQRFGMVCSCIMFAMVS